MQDRHRHNIPGSTSLLEWSTPRKKRNRAAFQKMANRMLSLFIVQLEIVTGTVYSVVPIFVKLNGGKTHGPCRDSASPCCQSVQEWPSLVQPWQLTLHGSEIMLVLTYIVIKL